MKAIIVFYDTLNRRYLPCYNPQATTITPNFDRLAHKACVFDNSYVGSMPCIPARRELHTGRINFLHREWGPLEPFDDSMPEILKNNGIYTHLVSDHLHYWEDGGTNYHTRYSSWEIVRGQEGDHWKGELEDPDIPPVVSVPQKQQGQGTSSLWRYDWINRKHLREEADFPQTRTFDLGCEFIEKNHDQDNWLLHIETFDPHEPFYAPQRFLDLYPEDYKGKHFDWPRGEVTQNDAEIAHCRRQYQALISMCDYSLGRVLDLMDRYQLWQDTLLIVGTDHGFLLGEHGWWGKNQMPYYNEIAHTPLFIWDPRNYHLDDDCQEESAKYKQGIKRRQSLVQMIDWAPTLYSFFGVTIPQDVQGSDLKQLIKDDAPNRLHGIYGVFGGHVNVTDGHYAYLHAPVAVHRDDIYNYTLVPHHMTQRFTAEELQEAELVKAFTFTKGCPLLKIKSHDRYNVARFGTQLFDLKKDPLELHPLKNQSKLKEHYQAALRWWLHNTDAPQEQYQRLGISAEGPVDDPRQVG